MVRVQVRDNLKATVQRDDLSLEVLLQDAAQTSALSIRRLVKTLRDETNADFLVEYLQDLLAGASLQKLAMHLQALNRLNAAFGWAQFQRCPFLRVVRAGPGELHDDMLDLNPRKSSGQVSTSWLTYLVHECIRTGIEARRDGVIQHIFESLLLPHYRVEKVGTVDVWRLQ